MTTTQLPLAVCAKEALIKRAKYAYPLEACGFIMNSADPDTEQFIFEVPNVARNPRHNWEMGADWMRVAFANEDDIFGVWHTHPNGPDGPSETDLRFTPAGLRFFVATVNGVYEYGMERQ